MYLVGTSYTAKGFRKSDKKTKKKEAYILNAQLLKT